MTNRAASEPLPLARHALERCLERTQRAPSWLEGVLHSRQFAHLRQLAYEGRRAVLVFDALTNEHIIVVLARDTLHAVTVFTRSQYERTFGPIPAVVVNLAKMARQQACTPVAELPAQPASLELHISANDRASRKLRGRWQAGWACHIGLCKESGRLASLRAKLAPVVKQHYLVEAYTAGGGALPDDVVPEVASLPFARQARLVAESLRFQEWLMAFLESQSVDVEHLAGVRFKAGKDEVDVTFAFSQALSR